MHLTSFCKNCKPSIAYRAAKCNSSDDNFRKEDGGDGSKKLKGPDVMKTKSSYRTLPLIPQVETVLREEQTKQGEMKEAFRSAYSKKYLDYVCVDAIGNLITPQYITTMCF